MEQSSGWLKRPGARAARAARARSLGLALGAIALIASSLGCGGSEQRPASDAAVSIPSVTVPDAVAEASAASGQAQHGKKQAQPAVHAHNKASPVESTSPSTTGGRAPGDDKGEGGLTSSSSGGGNRAAGDDKGERTGTSSGGGNRAAGDDKGQR